MKRRGFTLLEILLAIGIIALLAAILLPVVSAAKTSGQVATATSNVRQIVKAALLYSADSDGQALPSQRYNTVTTRRMTWAKLIEPYLKSVEILTAPGAEPVRSREFAERGSLSWGLNAATAVNAKGCSRENDPDAVCAGYRNSLSIDGLPAQAVLFSTTPGGDTGKNYCGFEFEPLNGPSRFEEAAQSPPLVSDRDLVKSMPTLPCIALRPVFARYGSTGQDDGKAVLGMADGSAKAYTSKQIAGNGAGLIWRLRQANAR